ncbi:hypothetical protein QYE76_029676 [Lolium multiflorum]|uniref:Protein DETOXIFICATION n=1 Tax=Lolium multiflorum TaxID=4521 RepID=A0AAD8VIH2_LOLMU|nr:hypothetical protein QYE76_029676 [Lolium multiflorum]
MEKQASLEETLLPRSRPEWKEEESLVASEEVKRQLWLAGPLIAGNLMQNLVPMISVMLVGHLGELPLAGASMANSFATVTGFSLLKNEIYTLVSKACIVKQLCRFTSTTDRPDICSTTDRPDICSAGSRLVMGYPGPRRHDPGTTSILSTYGAGGLAGDSLAGSPSGPWISLDAGGLRVRIPLQLLRAGWRVGEGAGVGVGAGGGAGLAAWKEAVILLLSVRAPRARSRSASCGGIIRFPHSSTSCRAARSTAARASTRTRRGPGPRGSPAAGACALAGRAPPTQHVNTRILSPDAYYAVHRNPRNIVVARHNS